MILIMTNKQRKILVRFITALLVCFFIMSDAFALAPQYVADTPAFRLKYLRNHLEKSLDTQCARTPEKKAFMEECGDPEALLLSTGKRLVAERAWNDDLRFVRANIHEDIEILMQILREKDKYRYYGIRDLVLRKLPMEGHTLDTSERYVNHIIAMVFEWLTLVEAEIIDEAKIPEPYAALVCTLKGEIRSRKHSYFLSDFWDLKKRQEKIKDAIKDGMRFYQTASEKSGTKQSIAVEDNVDKLIRWHRTGKGFEVGDMIEIPYQIGGKKEFRRKHGYISFILDVPGKEGDTREIVFVGENDPNHGFVVNIYLADDYKNKSSCEPIATYKYYEYKGSTGKWVTQAISIPLGKLDVIKALKGERLKVFNRPTRVKIDQRPQAYVCRFRFMGGTSIAEDEHLCLPVECANHFREKGKYVIARVEYDEERGQGVSFYFEKDYRPNIKSKRAILTEYENSSKIGRAFAAFLEIKKYQKGQAPKKVKEQALGMNLYTNAKGEYEARVMQGRQVIRFLLSKIADEFFEKGDTIRKILSACFAYHPDYGRYVEVRIYPRRILEGALVKLEKYIEKADIETRKRRSIQSSILDLFKLMPCSTPKEIARGAAVLSRKLERHNNEDVIKDTLARLRIFVKAAGSDRISDREITRDGILLAKRYYRKECGNLLTELETVKMMDYILGDRNIYGKKIKPPTRFNLGLVNKDGRAHIVFGSKQIFMHGFKGLEGREIILVRVPDEKFEFVFHAYDTEDYKNNPDGAEIKRVLIRDLNSGLLIPIERKDVYYAKELIEKGMYRRALEVLEAIPVKGIPVFKLRRQAREGLRRNESAAENPGLLNEDERLRNHSYILARLICSGKSRESVERYMKFFPLTTGESPDRRVIAHLRTYFVEFIQGIARDGETIQVITNLMINLDMESDLPAQAHVNIAVIEALAESSDEYKTEALALELSRFLDYEGILKDETLKVLQDFFYSIPDNDKVFLTPESENGRRPKGSDYDGLIAYIRSISSVRRLTRLGEIKFGVLKELGDENAEMMLYESCLRLVVYIVRKEYLGKSKFSFMELITIGNGLNKTNGKKSKEGLIKSGLARAAHRHKPQYGRPFASYAGVAVRRALDGVINGRKNDVTLPYRLSKEASIFESMCREQGLDPGNYKIHNIVFAEALNFTEAEVGELRAALFGQHYMNKPDMLEDGGESDSTEKIASRENELYKKVVRPEMVDVMIKRAIEIVQSMFPPGKMRGYKRRILIEYVSPVLKGKSGMTQHDMALRLGFSRRVNKGESVGSHMRADRRGNKERGLYAILRRAAEELDFSIDDFSGGLRDRTTGRGLRIERGSPGDALRVIYDVFGFKEFKRADLLPLRKYHPSTVDVELRMLRELGLLIRVKRGTYRLSAILRGSNDEETSRNIAALYNMEFKIGRKNVPLARYEIPDGKLDTVRELIKAELSQRYINDAMSAKERTEPATIRVWKGYASPSQGSMLTRIENISQKGPYKIEFLSLEELMESASKEGNQVTIMPHKKGMQNNGSIIYMNPRKRTIGAEDIVQIGGIIATGVAYLNNNDLALRNLYKLLTGKEKDITVSKLMEDPAGFIFGLKVKKVDIDDLMRLNERIEELLESA